MNPFDLRGPEFLLFYSVLSAAVLALIAWRRWHFEPHPPVRDRLADPFLIAYLRAGRKEVLRVTILSLVERGLLKANGAVLETKAPADHPELPALEQLLLKRFEHGGGAWGVFSDTLLARECDKMGESLASKGLVPDAAQHQLRWLSSILGVVVLVIVALTKVAIALERGKTSVLFLVLLAVGVSIGAIVLAHRPHRTRRGTAALQDLRLLLHPAKERISPAASPAELAMVAAAFGAAALPFGAERAKRIFPKAPASSGCSSGCGISWGSSCGSGGGSGGGSSCGGGGCGGGCGGCGGS